MSRYRLIGAERTSFPTRFMRRILGVSRRGYHDWRDRPPSKSSHENVALPEKIHEIRRRSRETYEDPTGARSSKPSRVFLPHLYQWFPIVDP